MKFSIALVAIAAIAGCSSPKPVAEPGGADFVDGYALGEPVVYQNAAFVPVLTTDPQVGGAVVDTITLAEAKENGWVEIIEIPGDEQVEMLKVRNNGPKPILLLSGELLLGGKQDRVVAKDTIVKPGETKDVAVFCVEHGRWDNMSRKFEYSGTMVPDGVRKSAQYSDQAAVWDEVAGKNRTVASMPAENASSIRTFLSDRENRKKIQAASDEVSGRLRGESVVGVLFILDGEIQTLEVFDTPGLFKKAHRPILESFLAEAMARESSGPRPLDRVAYADFIAKCLSAPAPASEGYNAIDGEVFLGRGYNMEAGAKPAHSSFSPK